MNHYRAEVRFNCSKVHANELMKFYTADDPSKVEAAVKKLTRWCPYCPPGTKFTATDVRITTSQLSQEQVARMGLPPEVLK